MRAGKQLRLVPIALCLASCGAASATSANSGSPPNGASRPVGSASPTLATSWHEQLSFSGPVSGSVTEGIITHGAMCSGSQSIPGHYLEVHFDIVLAGTTYNLVLHAMYIAGVGAAAIDSNGVTVAASITTPGFVSGVPPFGSAATAAPAQGSRLTADSGTITIAAGGEKGTVDVSMEGVPPGGASVPLEHMSGSWSCSTLPAPSGSTPEGLAFAGDISGPMTAATPDPASGGMPAVCAPFSGSGAFGNGFGISIGGDVQGTRWNLSVGLAARTLAAGSYTNNPGNGTLINVEILAGTGNPDSRDWLSDIAGRDPATVTLNPGLLSGTVDLVAKPRMSSSTGPTSGPTQVHITGSFNCVQGSAPSS
jgi:hypothetical protein